MSQLVPASFPAQPDAGVTTYTFTEASTGLGIITYKAFTAQTSGSTTYNLGTTDLYSSTISTTRSTEGVSTLTFDSETFNFPRTVKGKAYFSAGIGTTALGYMSGAVQLQKWDGTTATDISSNIEGPTVGGSAYTNQMLLIPLPLTQTTIQKGEQLRCVVKFYTQANDSEICHDPLGRAGTIVSGAKMSTTMNLHVPFRVDA